MEASICHAQIGASNATHKNAQRSPFRSIPLGYLEPPTPTSSQRWPHGTRWPLGVQRVLLNVWNWTESWTLHFLVCFLLFDLEQLSHQIIFRGICCCVSATANVCSCLLFQLFRFLLFAHFSRSYSRSRSRNTDSSIKSILFNRFRFVCTITSVRIMRVVFHFVRER